MALKNSLLVVTAVVAVVVLIYDARLDNRLTNLENAVVAIHSDVSDIKEQISLSRTTQRIKYTEKDIDCLARNIYWEAGVEDMMGKIAVGTVTVNRVKTGVWGKDICKVVYAKNQFSWTQVARRAWVSLKGPSWEDSKTAAKVVLKEGVHVKQLNKALFYHADYVDPTWRDNREKVAKIGRHIFYKKAKGNRTEL